MKKVLDFVPTRTHDEVLISLHENDYDILRTVDFLLEGGTVAEDWQTVGSGGKSKKQPNQNESDVPHKGFYI